MCCFSRPIISVSATNIFARAGEDGRQFLVYSMILNARDDLAMVLPLPVKIGTGEKGVSFIDLSGYPDFFADLRIGFPEPIPPPTPVPQSGGITKLSARRLEVVTVGKFEASFVPTMKDFSRLDERFRIGDEAWKQLPQYHDYGFAVFKLKSGETKVHPMAFAFPRRDTKTLFFPTVHIHDGKVHSEAEFDHVLYCQPSEHVPLTVREWRESESNANKFMKLDKARGLIVADQHCYKKELRGQLPNRDTLVALPRDPWFLINTGLQPGDGTARRKETVLTVFTSRGLRRR